MAGRTLLAKILADHVTQGDMEPGHEVRIRIDQTLCQDATGTMAFLELEAMGIERVKTDLSVAYVDHNTSQFGPENQNDHLYLESVAAAKGVCFSRAGNGICHQVHLERFGVPGKTLLGSDSHTPTGGGIGMVAIGAGGLDVALAMAGVPFKVHVPRVIGVRLTGRLGPWVAAKDVILHLLSLLSTKGNVGTAVEYFGPGVGALTVPERATITNMGAELGVTTSIFPSDRQTRAFLRAQGREAAWCPLAPDPDAVYDRVIDVDLTTIEPLAACPSSPDHVRRVRDLGEIPVGQVVIGSCTNSSLKDLSMVASLLRGQHVNLHTSVAVAPGSRQVLGMLARSGALADLIAAGVRILETACGPCIGQGLSPATGGVTVRTFNRNFTGRTGTRNDQCYLVSPETAVAAALTGKLVDPRSLGLEYPRWHAPRKFLVDDSMVLLPPPAGTPVDIVRRETIGEPPRCTPFPEKLDGEVLIKLGDKITTDDIMPAGPFLKFRSNIPVYAKYVFNGLNQAGKSSFAEHALAVRSNGRWGIIVAGESYGQGSSREHAAICPMHLGVRAVLARSFERIHAANLVNFGILPLLLSSAPDWARLAPGMRIVVEHVDVQLRDGPGVVVHVTDADNQTFSVECRHTLSAEEVTEVLAGGRLNVR